MSSPAEYESFWSWCADVGVESRRLAIRKEGSVAARGLFLEEAVHSGAVLISIPYMACINRQICARSQLSRSIPPIWAISKALRLRRSGGSGSAEHMWLALALQRLAAHNSLPPFVKYFTPSGAEIALGRASARRALSTSGKVEFDEINALSKRWVSTVSELDRRWSSLIMKKQPTTGGKSHTFQWREANFPLITSHDVVISRCVDLPTAPADWRKSIPLTDLVEEHPETPVLPTLVPLVELINSSNDTAGIFSNCELYSCTAKGDKRSLLLRKDDSVQFERRRIAICATRSIAAGEELLMSYDVDDLPSCAFRFGFVPAGERSSKKTQ